MYLAFVCLDAGRGEREKRVYPCECVCCVLSVVVVDLVAAAAAAGT